MILCFILQFFFSFGSYLCILNMNTKAYINDNKGTSCDARNVQGGHEHFVALAQCSVGCECH